MKNDEVVLAGGRNQTVEGGQNALARGLIVGQQRDVAGRKAERVLQDASHQPDVVDAAVEGWHVRVRVDADEKCALVLHDVCPTMVRTGGGAARRYRPPSRETFGVSGVNQIAVLSPAPRSQSVTTGSSGSYGTRVTRPSVRAFESSKISPTFQFLIVLDAKLAQMDIG
ncbi:MAG: hypothetical protein O3A25_07050 [Acidobacteria bacterium]|nr:hypothetical protein [Acidobacteriota bacterium]